MNQIIKIALVSIGLASATCSCSLFKGDPSFSEQASKAFSKLDFTSFISNTKKENWPTNDNNMYEAGCYIRTTSIATITQSETLYKATGYKYLDFDVLGKLLDVKEPIELGYGLFEGGEEVEIPFPAYLVYVRSYTIALTKEEGNRHIYLGSILYQSYLQSHSYGFSYKDYCLEDSSPLDDIREYAETAFEEGEAK